MSVPQKTLQKKSVYDGTMLLYIYMHYENQFDQSRDVCIQSGFGQHEQS